MYVIGILSIALIATAICVDHYHGKYKSLKSKHDERCKDLALDNERIQEVNECLLAEIDNYEHLILSACKNLKVLVFPPLAYDNITQGSVIVAGVDTRRSDLYITIKIFPYDIDNPEDRDFAIREAEELIETIQNF